MHNIGAQVKVKWIGLFGLITLLALSLVFYRERISFLDSSYHLFFLLKDGTFAIQNFRFVAIFTQSIPLLLSYLHLPLNAIAIGYSASYVLLQIAIFWIIAFKLKNETIAIAYLLFCFLLTTHTFFWVQSELPQGINFLFLLMAILERQEIRWRTKQVLSLILIPFIVFAHPLAIIPLIYFVLYNHLNKGGENKNGNYRNLFLLFAASILYVFKFLFFKTPYDNAATNFISNFKNQGDTFFQLNSTQQLASYLIGDYLLFSSCFILLTIILMCYKQWSKLVLLLSFTIGYTILVNYNYPDGGEQFYFENQYLILGVFVVIPFSKDLLSLIKNNFYRNSLIALILLISIIRIYRTHTEYTARLNWYRSLITNTNKLPQKKLIIEAENIPMKTLKMTWASSYECWFVSSLEFPSSSSIIIEEQKHEFDWALHERESFRTKWGCFNYSSLDKRYFKFDVNDTSAYQKVTLIRNEH